MPRSSTETRGRALLRAFLDEDPARSQRWLAVLLGIEQPSVSAWLRGLSRPEPHLRDALAQIARIPAQEWETPGERRQRIRSVERAERVPGLLATGTEGR
jgi:transcriptional regulator with XRE-family HTH domain